MTTISKELLTAKGTMDALIGLEQASTSLTVSEVSELMNASDGTARTRLDALSDRGLVTEDAELVEGRPVRVHELTPTGSELSQTLQSVITEYAPKSAEDELGEPTGADSDATVDVPTDTDERVEAEPEAE